MATPVRDSNPATHISSLAELHKAFCIQMVNPLDLFFAVDCSTDLDESLGYTMDQHFTTLLDWKYENCSEWFQTNLATLGIQEPVVVIIRSDGRWQMDEGHHRLSWALRHGICAIPVIFDDSGADDDSHMGYIVARTSTDAYHDTVDEDLITSSADTLVTETDEFLDQESSISLIPEQRKGQHRAEGKHRK
jgi:hypothetical protein